MDEPRVYSTRLYRIACAFTESATLYAALDLRFFSHVAAGAGSVDEALSSSGGKAHNLIVRMSAQGKNSPFTAYLEYVRS
jgi:hypothetical protein